MKYDTETDFKICAFALEIYMGRSIVCWFSWDSDRLLYRLDGKLFKTKWDDIPSACEKLAALPTSRSAIILILDF